MPTTDEARFWEYLKEEYSRIAEAHFNTNTTISLFFRYYLIIVSAPLGIIGLMVSLKPQGGINIKSAMKLIYTIHSPLTIVFFGAALVGLLVLWYVVNLRCDAILYARTVNSIRRLFKDQSNLDLKTRLRTDLLPESSHLPPYHERIFFWPVVMSFGLLNSVYFYLAWVICHFQSESYSFDQVNNILTPSILGWILISGFFLAHLALYKLIALYRERYYLQSRLVGVDIDGVLNEHRSQFAKILKEKAKKEIRPEDIVIIPVHKNTELGVTIEDEKKVFESPEYWLSMPVKDGAAQVFRDISDKLRLKMLVFTDRPWGAKGTRKEWRRTIRQHLGEKTRKLLEYPADCAHLYLEKPIAFITRKWLIENGFGSPKLYIKTGGAGWFAGIDRLAMARRKKIRFFVEDDLANAIKLSPLCDVVFLIDQPYNHTQQELPQNILRVGSWGELYDEMKSFV